MYSASNACQATSAYEAYAEAELSEVASSSVAAQSLLVSRLAIELCQSAQRHGVVVTGPRRCLVQNSSQ